MINKYKHTVIGILLVLSLSVSCTKFDEINTNPDAVTKVPPSMECTNIIIRMIQFGGDAMSYISSNALPKYVGFTVLGQNGSQYNTIGSASFGPLTILPNIDAMLEQSKGTVMDNSYKGIASFARAITFFNMTMWMGDIPCSEAGKGNEGLFKPKYDTQESVFIAILEDLKAADQFFANGVTFEGDPTPYNGDPAKWRKACNAFTIRVLLSLSKKENLASLDIKNRFAQIAASGNLMDKTTGYLGLEYTIKNPHPLYSVNSMFTPKTVVSSLLVENLKTLNDRRLFYFCEPSPVMLVLGLTESDYDSYQGVDVAMDYGKMNDLFKSDMLSILNKRYAAEFCSDPGMMMSYAEQELNLAEGAVRGWIGSGTAQTHYKQGVTAALEDMAITNSTYAHSMPITPSYITSYLSGKAAFKSTPAEQLKQIWLQGYILRFMQDADFSYFEYRRNGYPDFPINPKTSLNENKPDAIPLRALYPGSEVNYNRENLVEALNRQYEGYDEINKVMWILK